MSSMAVVAFIFESDQVGQADYDGLMQVIGRESLDAPSPDGFIAHLSGPKPGGGWQVIDVWESEPPPTPSTDPSNSPPS
jgi:hypothetical protein